MLYYYNTLEQYFKKNQISGKNLVESMIWLNGFWVMMMDYIGSYMIYMLLYAPRELQQVNIAWYFFTNLIRYEGSITAGGVYNTIKSFQVVQDIYGSSSIHWMNLRYYNIKFNITLSDPPNLGLVRKKYLDIVKKETCFTLRHVYLDACSEIFKLFCWYTHNVLTMSSILFIHQSPSSSDESSVGDRQ